MDKASGVTMIAKTPKRLFILLFLLCAGSAWAADTTYFQQGGTNGTTDDGWLRKSSTDGYGATDQMMFEGDPGYEYWFIVRFDSCHVALSGKTVTAAWLNIEWLQNGTDSLTGNAYRVIQAWRETGNEYRSSPSWAYADSQVTEWTTAGCPNNDTCASATLESHVHFNTSGTYRFDLLTATVQGWIDTPANNEGIIINSPSTSDKYGDIYSSEYATTGYRPELVIVTSGEAPPAGAKTIVIRSNVIVKGTVR
jgi:hypothetical protein